jgi:hypothetical protein
VGLATNMNIIKAVYKKIYIYKVNLKSSVSACCKYANTCYPSQKLKAKKKVSIKESQKRGMKKVQSMKMNLTSEWKTLSEVRKWKINQSTLTYLRKLN